ncbi:MAG: tetratricopeptide repeat protein [Magnetococcales bacterium]|nr:tetratricopeptide repeat protein [Magnetococcales bacterium]
MLINYSLTLFLILGLISVLGGVLFAWRRANQKPVEAQDWKRSRAETLWKDAVDLQSKGNFSKALEKWKQSAGMESDSSHPRPGFLGQVHNELGYCYYRSNMFQESEENFKKSLAFFHKTSRRATFDTAFTLNNYALLCMETGRRDVALSMLKKSMRIFTSGLGEKAPQMVHVLNNLARSHMQIGAYSEALAVLEKALDIAAHSLLSHYPEVLLVKELLAETYQHLGNLDDAERLFLEVVASKETLHGPQDPGILPALNALGRFYLKQGFLEKSLALYERILSIIRGHYGEEHHFVGEFLNQYACLNIQTGAFEEAGRLLAESHTILTKTNKHTHPSMLINIYLRLWLAHHGNDAHQGVTLFKRAMILLQIPELAAMSGMIFHLAALVYHPQAPLSAAYLGKKGVHRLLTKKDSAGHAGIVPSWLISPSEQPIWKDLGSVLRQQHRIFEAQALGVLFPVDRPVISSLHEKVMAYLKTGWQSTEQERSWDEALEAWQRQVATLFFPAADPSPKPSEIINNSEMMTPILEELDRIFATLSI